MRTIHFWYTSALLTPLTILACGTTTTGFTTETDGLGGLGGTTGDTDIKEDPRRKVYLEEEFEASAVPGISKRVFVRTHECQGAFAAVSCSVDPDEVVIGGGAWIERTAGERSFLTGTYPADQELTGWVGSQQSLEGSTNSTLKVYAIGLRFEGIARSELRDAMILHTESSGSSAGSGVSAGTPGYYLMLGGGARTVADEPGLFLTRLEPDDDATFSFASFSLGGETVGYVEGYAIGLSEAPFDGFLPLETERASGSTFAQSGVGVAMGGPHSGWVRTCLGAVATSEDMSETTRRFLTGVAPFGGDSRAASSDGATPGSGVTAVYDLTIRVKP